MNADELILLLKSMADAHRVAEAVRDPALQKARGWDLARWTCEEVRDAVRFVHCDRKGRPESAVLCVDNPGPSQWVYEVALRLASIPTELLVLKS
jgi:hypothetical protein